MLTFNYNDGGRSNYFKTADVRDCVTRSISIAAKQDYKEVYDLMSELMEHATGSTNVEDGVLIGVYHITVINHGFTWIEEDIKFENLPTEGTLLIRVDSHLSCMIDGVIQDIFDPREELEELKVKGYYFKPTE